MKKISIILVLIFVAGVGWCETAEEWFNKGMAAHEAKNFDEAINFFNKAIATDSNIPEAYYNLGLLYYEKGMHDEAIAKFKKAVSISPNYALTHIYLAFTYDAKGMLDFSWTVVG